MKGQIANFSPQHGQGIIMGDDGKNYPFTSQQWQQATAPMAGQQVEFNVDAQGYAVAVVGLAAGNAINLNKPIDSTIAPIPHGYTDNPTTANYGQVTHAAGMNAVNPAWAIEENYGFFDWVKKSLSNYANFKGRARRKEYWYFYLAWFMLYLGGAFIDYMIGTDGIVAGLIALALVIPNIAVAVRRLHDVNKSGWWMLIAFIPIIGGIMLLVWYCTDTKPNVNQWGAPARRLP